MRAGLLLLVLLSAACGKHAFNRDDLDVSLATHHIDLRWGRLENAAQAVIPEMRGAFVAEWTSRLRGIELQDIEIAGVVMSEDGDRADVVVNITWIDRATMSVVTSTVAEKWVRTDTGWRLITPPGTLARPTSPTSEAPPSTPTPSPASVSTP